LSPIKLCDTGLVYRNPMPHLRSIHAYFGSVAIVSGKEMVAAFDLGSAFEAADVHTHVARSTDGGKSWTQPEPMWPLDAECRKSSTCRISAMGDGELVGFGALFDRSKADEGLGNSATQGFVPTEMMITRSSDGGRTWQGPTIFEPPIVGPAFEVCATIRAINSDKWVVPSSTWPDWDGNAPSGRKAIMFVSHDRGVTWPESVDIMDRWSEGIVHWEVKLVKLADGRLLSVAWAHDLASGRDLPVQYALSGDEGASFSPPRSTELIGQTCTPFALSDGRIVCAYRRTDKPGLWAQLAHLDGDKWVNDSETRLWGAPTHLGDGKAENAVEQMSKLRFGFPCGVVLDGLEVFFVCWCYEDCVSNIRWFRIKMK